MSGATEGPSTADQMFVVGLIDYMRRLVSAGRWGLAARRLDSIRDVVSAIRFAKSKARRAEDLLKQMERNRKRKALAAEA